MAQIKENIQDGLRAVIHEINQLESRTAFEAFRELLMNDLGKTIDNATRNKKLV